MFNKGQSGNPGGRPRAAKPLTTREAAIEKLETLLCQFLVDNFHLIEKTDTPHDLKRAKFFMELMKFIVPRAAPAKEKEIKFENLSTDQLGFIVDDLMEKSLPQMSAAAYYDLKAEEPTEFIKELITKLEAEGVKPQKGTGMRPGIMRR